MGKVRGHKINKEKNVYLDEKNDIVLEDTVDDVENNSQQTLKIRKRKIRTSEIINNDTEELELDESVVVEDNLSLGLMIFILVVCVLVGVFLGYFLYRLAINSSALS